MLPITPLDDNWSRVESGSTIVAVFDDESENKVGISSSLKKTFTVLQSVGVVRAISVNAGLAVMRLKEALVAKQLFCMIKTDEETTRVPLRAHLPFWWPRKDGAALAIADTLDLHGDSHVHMISSGNRQDH